MFEDTYSSEQVQRIVLNECDGDLNIEAHDEPQIMLFCDEQPRAIKLENGALMIKGVEDDLNIRIPYGLQLIIDSVSGDTSIRGAGEVSLSNANSDVSLAECSGTLRLAEVHSDLQVEDSGSLIISSEVHGEATLRRVGQIELNNVQGDVSIEDAQIVSIRRIHGELSAKRVAGSLRVEAVEGDVSVKDISGEVSIGSANGEALFEGIGQLVAGSVGGDLHARRVAGALRIGNVGGDADVGEVDAQIDIGNVGGDCVLKAAAALLNIGNVGSDLRLSSDFPVGSTTRVHVGGDARIELPNDANVVVKAFVGGEVSGKRGIRGSGPCSFVFGAGAATLSLHVGGDLDLRGGGEPRSTGERWEATGEEFGRGMERWGEEFGRDMERWGEEFGRDMERFGRDIEQAGPGRAEEITRKIEERTREIRERTERAAREAEERARRAEERARRGEERARRHGEHGEHGEERKERVRIVINDREWRFDPERVNQLKERARQAAAEGIAGALEAVERALAGMAIPSSPSAPTPPTPPSPSPVMPMAPMPPVPPIRPMPPMPGATQRVEVEVVDNLTSAEGQMPATGVTVKIPTPAESATLEEQRAAILQMVAEGRITPEEGDLLLESIG